MTMNYRTNYKIPDDIVRDAIAQGYDPVMALMDYLEEKDSCIPRVWAEWIVNRVITEMKEAENEHS